MRILRVFSIVKSRASTRIQIAVLVVALSVLTAVFCYPAIEARGLFVRPWLPRRPEDTARIEKALIVPTVRMREVQWLNKDHLKSYTPFIYCMANHDRPECLHPHTTKGREAAAYLSYIVDHYDRLPRYNIFIHSKPKQEHNDILGESTEPILTSLRFEAVEALGYVNLRCTHRPTCPSGVLPHSPPKIEGNNGPRVRYLSTYQELFNVTEAQVPDTIGYICCAQFAVTRAQIHKRPLADYRRALNWLVVFEKSDSHEKGWVMETVWHILFGQAPVLCPEYDQCACDLYGLCGPFEGGQKLKPVGG